MPTSRDYQIGTAALGKVIETFIKANVPGFLMGQVEQYQSKIDEFKGSGAKAVVDAVDADHANIAKGLS